MGRNVASLPNDDPERTARIQDAKLRLIGVDKQALEAQVQERKDRESDEQNASMQYTRLANYFADQVQLKQQEADMLRLQSKLDQEEFRKQHQTKDQGNTWDINDPRYLQLNPPARTTDDPADNPVSGFQLFDGEDLGAGDRTKAQMSQCQSWWDQQKKEREALKEAERMEDMQYAALLKAQEALQQDCVKEEQTLRKGLSTDMANENSRLAAEKAAREKALSEETLEKNKHEQHYQAGSQFLTEDPATATSALSDTRFRPDHFKGYNKEAAKDVRDYQQRQVEEKAARKAQELEDDMLYARYMNSINKALTEKERAVADFKKKQADLATSYLTKQKTEKLDRDTFLNKTLYTNQPDSAYFGQFGTSHR